MPLIEAKPRAFYIVLENNQQVFYAGQQVRGSVVIDLPEEKKTRGVHIQLTGIAHTHFIPTHCECCNCCSCCGCEVRDAGYTSPSNKYKSDTTEFYKLKLTLWEPKGTDKMPPGTYNLPFAFTIAPEMDWPASFKANSGDLAYVLKANIDRPWKFDHKTYLGLTILPMVDANNPIFLQPQNKDGERSQSWFGKDSVLGRVSVPRKAFAPGEVLQTMVTIENHGKKNVKGFDVALVQLANFYAGKGDNQFHAMTRRVLAHTSCGIKVGGFQNSQPTEVTLQVPSACPSIRLSAAKLIEVSYVVEVVIAASKKLRIHVPVELSTVPYVPPQMVQSCPWANPQAIMAHAAATLMPAMMAPPMYDDVYANCEPVPAQYTHDFAYPVYAPSAPPMSGQQPQYSQMPQSGYAGVPVAAVPGTVPMPPVPSTSFTVSGESYHDAKPL